MSARLKSLKTAGVVGYFVPVAVFAAMDRFCVERQTQFRLSLLVPRHKEFFQCDWRMASSMLQTEVARDNAILSQLVGASA